jgi:hypothetical protein
VKWSVGQDDWARVPWIACLDDRETTTQEGVYAVDLRQDMSGGTPPTIGLLVVSV